MPYQRNANPLLSEGRRVLSSMKAGVAGTIVKIRPPMGIEVEPSYDVVWDDRTGNEKIAQALLVGPLWKVLPEVVRPEVAESRRRDYLEIKLKKRTDEAKQRIEASGAKGAPLGGGIHNQPVAHSAAVPTPASPALRDVAKHLRDDLAREYEGVQFTVHTKGQKIEVSWFDGPVYIRHVTEKYSSVSSPLHVDRILTKRAASEALIESAIEYVRQVVPGVARCGKRLDSGMYLNRSLRDIYPESGSAYSGVSIGMMVRVVLLRWDDYSKRFVGEGLTRAMVQENKALFDGGVPLANMRMRGIRSDFVTRNSEEFEEVVRRPVDAG